MPGFLDHSKNAETRRVLTIASCRLGVLFLIPMRESPPFPAMMRTVACLLWRGTAVMRAFSGLTCGLTNRAWAAQGFNLLGHGFKQPGMDTLSEELLKQLRGFLFFA